MGDMHDHDERFRNGEHLRDDDLEGYAPRRPSGTRRPKHKGWATWQWVLFSVLALAWVLFAFGQWVEQFGVTWAFFVDDLVVSFNWAWKTSLLTVALVIGWAVLRVVITALGKLIYR